MFNHNVLKTSNKFIYNSYICLFGHRIHDMHHLKKFLISEIQIEIQTTIEVSETDMIISLFLLTEIMYKFCFIHIYMRQKTSE